jgi:hypothetical protein
MNNSINTARRPQAMQRTRRPPAIARRQSAADGCRTMLPEDDRRALP